MAAALNDWSYSLLHLKKKQKTTNMHFMTTECMLLIVITDIHSLVLAQLLPDIHLLLQTGQLYSPKHLFLPWYGVHPSFLYK